MKLLGQLLANNRDFGTGVNERQHCFFPPLFSTSRAPHPYRKHWVNAVVQRVRADYSRASAAFLSSAEEEELPGKSKAGLDVEEDKKDGHLREKGEVGNVGTVERGTRRQATVEEEEATIAGDSLKEELEEKGNQTEDWREDNCRIEEYTEVQEGV